MTQNYFCGGSEIVAENESLLGEKRKVVRVKGGVAAAVEGVRGQEEGRTRKISRRGCVPEPRGAALGYPGKIRAKISNRNGCVRGERVKR